MIETAHRALGICGQVLRYGIATGRAANNPTRALHGALQAVTAPVRIGELLRSFDGYEGSLITRCALELAPLVFARPEEFRTAKWEDIDFETQERRFTASKTKTPHIVPLATQAVSVLRDISRHETHGYR